MRAAVAIILRDGAESTEFLMMQRAAHENDPWSGQMSFPGGKLDPTDESARHAAERETLEEVGLPLEREHYIGQLDDLYGLKVNNQYSVHVSCFVYKFDRQIELQTNHEVADTVWLPMAFLDQPENAMDYRHPHDPSLRMPAVLIDESKEQVLWGMSLRMLITLYQLLGRELRVLSAEDRRALDELERLATEKESERPELKRLAQG